MASRRADGARLHLRNTFRPRRIAAAFLLGVAISVAGLAALAANRATARGAFAAFDATVTGAAQPSYSLVPLTARAQDDDRPRRHHERITLVKAQVKGATSFGRDAVCVRLCDGYFFPLPTNAVDSTAQTASCNSLCPDAPTDVYYRNGSDRIEDSVSLKGQLYSALPVSLRYRSNADNTCSCHRDFAAAEPLRDPTLKRGDAVMTPAGIMVFNGAERSQHAPNEFTALANASISAAARSQLQTLERASLEKDHPALAAWLAGQGARPAAKVASIARIAAAAPRVASADNRIRMLVWRGAQD